MIENPSQDHEIMNKIGLPPYPPLPNNLGYFGTQINSISNYQTIPLPNIPPQNNPYIPPPDTSPVQNLPEKTSLDNNQQPKTSANEFCTEKQKQKSYIDYLINTVNNLLSEGKITLKYLEEKTEPKIIPPLGEKEEKSIKSITSSLKNNSHKDYSSKSRKNSFQNQNNTYYYENIHGINSKRSFDNEKRCENPFCKYVFSSNKEKNRVKINGAKANEKILCDECCKAVDSRQFCYYCGAIYREKLIDTAVWIECDYCHKWEHFECELHKGKRYSNRQELNNVKRYMCPDCANKREEKKMIDNELKKKLIKKKRKSDLFDEQSNKKSKFKDLRNLKSEKCSELLTDVMLIEQIKNSGL